MILKNKFKLSVVLLSMFLAVLACNLPQPSDSSSGGSPTPTIIGSAAIEQTLESNFSVDPAQGNVTFTVTEQEMTDYLAAQISQQSEIPLTEPRVVLQNGQFDFYAKSDQGFVTAEVHAVMVPFIDPNGQMAVQITSATVGPIAMPDSMLASFTDTINQNLAAQYNPQTTGVRADSITIADGTMTITGSPNQ